MTLEPWMLVKVFEEVLALRGKVVTEAQALKIGTRIGLHGEDLTDFVAALVVAGKVS